MARFGNMWRNERGSGVKTLALVGAVVALASVAASSALEKYARVGGSPTYASVNSRPVPLPGAGGKSPVFDGTDMSATGSINRPIVLEPCTGKEKS